MYFKTGPISQLINFQFCMYQPTTIISFLPTYILYMCNLQTALVSCDWLVQHHVILTSQSKGSTWCCYGYT